MVVNIGGNELNGMLAGLVIILLIALIIFWISQFVSMLKSRKLNKTQKGIWFVLFITVSILTAIVWWFVKR